jgi:hypothetical protein
MAVTTLLAGSVEQDCRWLWAMLDLQAANTYLLAEIKHANRRDTMKQVPITAALKNLVHGLERNLIRKVFQVPSEADPPDLGPADNARPPLGSGCSWKSSK